MPIHTILADRDLLPAEHLMDAGYPSTKSLLVLRTEHQVRLIGPMRRDSSRHAREGSPYARDKFTIDFDQQRVTCPQGHHSRRGTRPAKTARTSSWSASLSAPASSARPAPSAPAQPTVDGS
jgi:hypothetical protein